MSIFSSLVGKIPVIGKVLGGAAKIIEGNQASQKNKGIIGQTYRENAYQQDLRQANTRQAGNESLNARGILSPGATPGPIGTALQQVAKSGGKKIAGSGVDPYLTAAGRGSVGAANTLAGGQNQQMADQFAYEDLGLARGKSSAEQTNKAQYYNTIGSGLSDITNGVISAVAGGFGGGGVSTPEEQATLNKSMSDYAGAQAAANRGAVLPITGAYNMPANMNFSSPIQGTVVGDELPTYNFHG